ncbi:hypothetical protein BKA67DRAFT_540387 [Truncatella angustata]|uniref:Uncharacterized protein n=1 Tax=Truncatella angustata TaxID=152316 RepID=A0A9P8RJD4_9PEZI|nr:uncharacterized protein BKA67DRAFT_540387 [Truncatella angustata]KAH6646919.1 hypothetical protein BKA67DRAFT_540387 [Truncatella angustata]
MLNAPTLLAIRQKLLSSTSWTPGSPRNRSAAASGSPPVNRRPGRLKQSILFRRRRMHCKCSTSGDHMDATTREIHQRSRTSISASSYVSTCSFRGRVYGGLDLHQHEQANWNHPEMADINLRNTESLKPQTGAAPTSRFIYRYKLARFNSYATARSVPFIYSQPMRWRARYDLDNLDYVCAAICGLS